MSADKHTPGPWSTRQARLSGDVGIAAAGFSGPIAEVFEELNRGDLRPETAQANARLIATAPELLGVLEEIQAVWESRGPTALMPSPERHSALRAMHARAAALIAKARGT